MYKIIVNLTFIILFLILSKTVRTAQPKPGKISREIIILSFIIILYALQGLPTLDFNTYYIKFDPLAPEIIFARYLVSWLIRIILFIAGIGIIFRKEIFRRVLIGLAFFNLLTVPWKHPLIAVKKYILFKIDTGVLAADLLPALDRIAWLYVGVYATLDIVVAAFFIYLLTRPGMKGQFK